MKDLDIKTKRELDELTSDELDRKNSYAYNHELLWYGLDGFAHFWLMKQARLFIEQGKDTQELQQRYGIKRGNEMKHSLAFLYGNTFFYPFSIVIQDGIYVPKHALRKETVLFDRSDIPSNRRFENNQVMNLCNRRWNLEDFANKELVEQGMTFGKELWKSGVKGFYKYKDGTEDIHKQSNKVTELGEKLIQYYSEIIEDN